MNYKMARRICTVVFVLLLLMTCIFIGHALLDEAFHGAERDDVIGGSSLLLGFLFCFIYFPIVLLEGLVYLCFMYQFQPRSEKTVFKSVLVILLPLFVAVGWYILIWA